MGGFLIKIEVECWSIEEVREVVSVEVDVVMLDNFEFKVFYRVVEVLVNFCRLWILLMIKIK